jgi:very-short-patch-repair endonuclease
MLRDPVCLSWRHDLAPQSQIIAAGLSYDTVRRRVRTGRWTEPLPRVICRTTGTLTTHQWRLAAVMYAGPGAVLSHATACDIWRLPVPTSDRIVVTVPAGRHPRSTNTVWVRQSQRGTRPRLMDGLPVTRPARSVVDAGLDLDRRGSVDALMGRSIQIGLVTLDDLADELDRAPSGGSRLLRLAMADVAQGSHAASEAQLLRLLRRSGLPMPEMNARVGTPLGTRYVDALWRAQRKGVEIDGQSYHLGPVQWQADLLRQNAIQTTGIVLLRVPARRLWTEPDAVIAEIGAFLRRDPQRIGA